MHRNILILNYLILNYPDQEWNIENIIYGYDYLLNQINYTDNYLFFPIYLYLYQLNINNLFNYYENNSLAWSINSLDLDWNLLINSRYFTPRIFLDYYAENNNFYDFVHQNITQTKLFELLSKCTNLDLKLVYKNQCLPWNWNLISENPSINYIWLDVFTNKDWNINNLLSNLSFKYNWIKYMNSNLLLKIDENNKYLILNSRYFQIYWIDIFNLDVNFIWRSICRHPNFRLDWLDYFPLEKYDLNCIILNNNFNLKWLKLFNKNNTESILFDRIIKSKYFQINLLSKYSITDIDCNLILKHNNFKIEWLLEIPKKYWNFRIISQSNNLSVSWLKKYPNELWDYKYIYHANKKFPFYDKEMIEYLLNLGNNNDFCFIQKLKNDLFANKLSINAGFDISWIYDFPFINWNFDLISQHPKLSLLWIHDNPHLNWNFLKIAKHKNIYPDDFLSLFNRINDLKIYDLYWYNLSLNPNISILFVREYNKYLYFDQLSLNNFNGMYYQNLIQKNIKKERIKIFEEELIKKTWHPSRVVEWCFEYNFNLL